MTLLNGTMTPIETVTVSAAGGTTGIQFNNIPQTYTDLVILLSAKTSRTQDNTLMEPMQIRFNSSTSGYRSKNLQGLPGTGYQVLSGGTTGETSMQIGQAPGTFSETASTFSNQMYYIPNYKNSTYKTVHCDSVTEGNRTDTALQIDAGIWDNSAAITSIEIFPRYRSPHAYATVLQQYSSATLYGVKSFVGDTGGKAIGGTVTSDSNYWYHTFTTSGMFTPTQNLNVDYLVVAGGGGGGGNQAAGGGGGGLRCTVGATGGGGAVESPLSLTSNTNYTVLIGAGGAGSNNSVGNNGSNSVFSTITAIGGGGGAGGGNASSGATGGSGGGGAGGNGGAGGAGGSGTANQGFAGGSGSQYRGGGGGGAGATGSNAPSAGLSSNSGGGAGGNGITTSISGISATYGGGGGGAAYGQPSSSITPASGGTGGGGAGGAYSEGSFNQNTSPVAGTANTGGGGGGNQGIGSAGGSGIVIIRYAK